MRMRQVFVPGGQPEHTYVSREKLGLERQLQAASDNLCKLVTVTGPTKSGKSVLAKKVYPQNTAVWIDGGSIRSEDDLWVEVLDRLGTFTDVTRTTARASTAEVAAQISAQAELPFIAKAQGQVTPKYGKTRTVTESRSRRGSPKSQAIEHLRTSRRPLVVDDFHYLDREVQGSVVRALKALVFGAHPIILLAIPHRKYDAIRVEKEMTGRVHQVPIPAWADNELQEIPHLGFPLLNVSVDQAVVDRFLSEGLQSPHLMQEFCRQLCELNAVEETCSNKAKLDVPGGVDSLLRKVAADTSKTIFERLAKGPRQRSDRNQRCFKDGRTGDIYFAVLMAIARLRPGMVTLEYEQVRAALRDLLVELPQAHEVSRVLEHMGTIQAGEAASAPVLDWDKDGRRLHIIDPFFAFYLRWGVESVPQLPGDAC